ncbi:DUF2868 domain-containing protein [Desulfogranum marinum]|uniref:DUF2868 domain-containing protein n=1 Tax=Desulfogranum marinum TaxID=453220 RepID=UPI00196440D0|nr:DUF2868 domain-containing protein [Desulfogranum marinum]MBM9515074.1 DUF2868 domain-containing protein [Desulfogranum marinum]
MSNTSWKIGDILDLEFFLDQDRQNDNREGEASLVQRDRTLYTQKILPQSGESGQPRLLVRKWLQLRREAFLADDGQQILPGKIWQDLFFGAKGIALGIGMLGGISVTIPFLVYSGQAPVNVTGYFALFVLLQFLLFTGQLFTLCWRKMRKRQLPASIFGVLLGRLSFLLMGKLQQVVYRKRSLFTQRTVHLFREQIMGQAALAPFVLWSIFLLLQLAGIGFNCGVIGATLGKVFVADTAFGWQSTLQVQESLIAETVRWLALPWSWVLPGHLAYPSLEAIAGSRIILKDGLYSLATVDLVSWWPFLCCSVLFYGLLPRVALLVFGLFVRNRLLKRIPSTEEPELRRLVRRMVTPTVKTSGDNSRAASKRKPSGSQKDEEEKVILPAVGNKQEVTFLLIPDELYDIVPLDRLTSLLTGSGAKGAVNIMRFGGLEGTDEQLLDTLANNAKVNKLAGVTLLQEAWQPPIEEIVSLLRDIRQAVGTETEILIGLIGKPAADEVLTPAEKEALAIWAMKITSLADPAITVTSLIR